MKVHYEGLDGEGRMSDLPICGRGKNMRRRTARLTDYPERVTCQVCRGILREIWSEGYGPDYEQDTYCAAAIRAWSELDARDGNLIELARQWNVALARKLLFGRA